ncbi:hypothetical protein Tco_0901824 [Tanacetum coccineum]
MAQQIIPSAQLVPKFQGIGRCNNYTVLQSVPCSHECKIVGKILLDHPLSYALTATADVLVMYQQQFWKTVHKVPDTEDTIKVSYQGVVDKVSALYTKNLAQPWQTMFKDDILLVSVYTTRNVTVRGMLIIDTFLTKGIRATNDYKEYETVTPTLTIASPQGKKRKQCVGESSSSQKSLKITIRQKHVGEGEKDKQSYDDVDYFDNRLELGSHKENPEHVDDDDDNEEEKKDEKEVDEMGSLEIRTEKMQIPLPTTPRSPRINLSSDKHIAQELTDTISLSTPTTSKDPHKQR